MIPKPNNLQQALLLAFLILSTAGVLGSFSSISSGHNILEHERFYKFSLMTVCAWFLLATSPQIIFKTFHKLPNILLVAAALLMIATIYSPLSKNVNGASRWLSLGGLSFQPVELAKLSYAVFLSHTLAKAKNPTFLLSCKIAGTLFFLVLILLMQPDFGSAVFFVVLTALFLFITNMSASLLGSCILGSGAIGAYFVSSSSYRWERITSFLDPWQHPQTSGYQLIQNMISYTNGGLFGVGWGESKQKLNYLPEIHNDYIYALFVEEIGGIGIFILFLSYLALFFCGIQILERQTSKELRLLTFAMTSLISLQFLLNAFVCLGLAPSKGLTSPFLSSGLSSYSSSTLALCILYHLASKSAEKASKHALHTFSKS